MRCWALLLLLLTCFALAENTERRHFTEKVHPSLPPLDFRVHITSDPDADNDAQIIDRITIRRAGKILQVIRFEEGDEPIIWGPAPIVELTDVDCDGYKDLLVRHDIGVDGNATFRLFRYNVKTQRFEYFPKFNDIYMNDLDCKTKTLKTYVNSGAAGCDYESGEYKWIKGDLVPQRIEEQDTDETGMAVRKVHRWQNGKETVTTNRYDPEKTGTCH